MKTKLWYYLIMMGLVFAACEEDADFRGGPPDHAGKGRVIATLDSEYDCVIPVIDGISQTDLIAGQHKKVGTVKVEFEGDYIIVTYETLPGWKITETHLHIGEDNEDFPLNKAGNPMIGLFQFGDDHDFKKVDGLKVIYTIPWENGCKYIAAHAVVKGVDYTKDLDAFAMVLPETATVIVNNPKYVKKSYFDVTVSEGGILDGVWPGWCIELNIQISPGTPYKADVFSSYKEKYGYDEEFLMKVNWVLNQGFVKLDGDGKPVYYTKGDVQIAIWLLLWGEYEFNKDVKKRLEETSPNPLNREIIGDYDGDRINKILKEAAMVDKFFPECGDVIAIVFENKSQDLIIEYPVPCKKGEETAWGQGCLFNERGNWAMYFMACP